jgi:uncharacterized membrane protein YhaH (DUF805 family)
LGLVLSVGLFVSLFAALLLFIVPQGVYDVSPAVAAADVAKQRIDKWLVRDKSTVLETIKKSAEEVVRTGLLTGGMLALLGFLVFFNFIGAFAVLVAVAFFFLGIFVTQKVLENEYRRWQDNLYAGVPQLVNFVPAFLEIEGITVREAIEHTLVFLPQPLRQEIWQALDMIKRTARVQDALDALARKANNPAVDAICFRLAANWNTSISADIFEDLNDQIQDMNELIVTRATVAKTGYLALICVLGLVGMILIFGYPGFKYLMQSLTGGFGM